MAKWWKSTVATVALAATCGVGIACATPRGRVYVRVGPPAPVADVRVVRPGPNYVWVPGYYRWDGRAYRWAAGAWMLPPRPRAVWVPGHWSHTRRGWFYVEGRWR